MTDRKYSVAEIDRMREAVRFHVTWGCKPSEHRSIYGDTGEEPGASREIKICHIAEDRLRTYMLAGIAPEELE